MKDKGPAKFGRKELSLPEHEMPDVWACRSKFGSFRLARHPSTGIPKAGTATVLNINGSLHTTIQTSPSRSDWYREGWYCHGVRLETKDAPRKLVVHRGDDGGTSSVTMAEMTEALSWKQTQSSNVSAVVEDSVSIVATKLREWPSFTKLDSNAASRTFRLKCRSPCECDFSSEVYDHCHE